MGRIENLILALLALLLLWPLILLLAIAVAVTIGRPVLFVQERPGLRSEIFCLYKFRTMRDARDGSGRPLPDEQRMTHFGSWLRRTSLDELPELWNVLRGDMNFVGPRPLLVEYLPLYTPEQARRHDVRPGITGWAQVNGRNQLSWEDKFTLDIWYVDNRSRALDLKILALTLAALLRTHEVSQEGQATTERFWGSK